MLTKLIITDTNILIIIIIFIVGKINTTCDEIPLGFIVF